MTIAELIRELMTKDPNLIVYRYDFELGALEAEVVEPLPDYYDAPAGVVIK